jgi:predicted anti-sigma-YlaC factor YlaD
MSAHLTTEEMTDRLLGVPSMTVDAHLLECQACLAEFNVMRASIDNFRGAAQSWSEDAMAVNRNLIAIAPRRKTWTAEWIVATAFLLLIILPVLYWSERKSPTASNSEKSPVAVSTQEQIEQDNELLTAVNSEITEGVPAPMQPLQVSLFNSSASSANQTK